MVKLFSGSTAISSHAWGLGNPFPSSLTWSFASPVKLHWPFHGSWLSSEQVIHERERKENPDAFYDLVSEVTYHHLYSILLVYRPIFFFFIFVFVFFLEREHTSRGEGQRERETES